MTLFEIHTPETAPAPAAETLAHLNGALGFVPNVFAVMATAPQVLRAFVELNQGFSESSLTPVQREIVQIAASVENTCGYCVAGHTAFAASQGVDEKVVAAVRNGVAIGDPKLQALHAFVLSVVGERGRLDPAVVEQFLAAGYSVAQMHEVILGICVKFFSNLTANLFGLPLDDAFVPYGWQTNVSRVN